MPTEHKRIMELALESLGARKRQIEDEIAELTRLLKRVGGQSEKKAGIKPEVQRKRSSFSKEEREKRSRRMKAYWEKWRAEKVRKK